MKRTTLGVYFCAILLSASWLVPGLVFAEERCLTDAWRGFNGQDYEAAIEASGRCIDQFGKAADREEAKLKDSPLPSPGRPKDLAAQQAIMELGLLNDVATAWFIKGRSAEYLYAKGGPKSQSFKDTATSAYEAACRYKHALTWDPKGWFWSPCEASSDRLPVR